MADSILKHPVYIVSKGRWKNPLTAKYFIRDQVPFKIAVEPQEYENYCESIGENFVLKLPFSNLGMGSYPARNFCWEDSIKNGNKRHFIFDDNIRGFDRLNYGKRIRCESMPALICLQDFVERFKNVAISGFNYDGFVTGQTKKPFQINTHVYSAMLIDNDLPFRWRLKYNEDVDLCLNALDRGYCTILLNVFVVNKTSTTAKMAGGNQDELYKNNDKSKKILKTKSLEMIWPQYVKTVLRFDRPHHQISWNKHFKHPLIKKL
jgi:hypothetical protein